MNLPAHRHHVGALVDGQNKRSIPRVSSLRAPLAAATSHGTRASLHRQPSHQHRLVVTCSAVSEEKGKKGRKPGIGTSTSKTTDDLIIEKGMRPLPRPAPYQQTLLKSFTMGGIGLHTGEYAYVRVRPAMAGEGRYIVRVPSDTNAHLFEIDQGKIVPEDELMEPPSGDVDIERIKVEAYLAFLEEQEDKGFHGNFQQWCQMRMAERFNQFFPPEDLFDDTPEEIVPRSEDEEYILCNIDNVLTTSPYSTNLGELEQSLMSVEALLSALEACGVDNCRIEVEGGPEVPVLDGSALGWVLEIQQAGLRPAPFEGHEAIPKVTMRPREIVTVRDGESFISLYPGDGIRVTVGIDHQEEASVIGKQWHTFDVEKDFHYRFDLAPARMYAPSLDWAFAARAKGFLQGGTEGCMIVAFEDRWYDPEMMRFLPDEPVRRAVVDLVGDLALLNDCGNGGLPVGHVVAYMPTHELQVAFARALAEAVTDDDYVPVYGYVDDSDEEDEQEQQEQQQQQEE